MFILEGNSVIIKICNRIVLLNINKDFSSHIFIKVIYPTQSCHDCIFFIFYCYSIDINFVLFLRQQIYMQFKVVQWFLTYHLLGLFCFRQALLPLMFYQIRRWSQYFYDCFPRNIRKINKTNYTLKCNGRFSLTGQGADDAVLQQKVIFNTRVRNSYFSVRKLRMENSSKIIIIILNTYFPSVIKNKFSKKYVNLDCFDTIFRMI